MGPRKVVELTWIQKWMGMLMSKVVSGSVSRIGDEQPRVDPQAPAQAEQQGTPTSRPMSPLRGKMAWASNPTSSDGPRTSAKRRPIWGLARVSFPRK